MAIKPLLSPWPGTMTARERFNRQMHYQSVDRCFNMEFGYWNENFTEWDLFRDNGIRNNAEAGCRSTEYATRRNPGRLHGWFHLWPQAHRKGTGKTAGRSKAGDGCLHPGRHDRGREDRSPGGLSL